MPTQVSVAELDTNTQSQVYKPKISSVTSTYSNFSTPMPTNVIGLSGGFIKIIGSGFTNNEQVFVRSIGSKGASIAPSVTYVSSTQLNCVMPASTSGTKLLYVVNFNGATAISQVTYQFVL